MSYSIDEIPWELVGSVDDNNGDKLLQSSVDPLFSSSEEEILQLNEDQLKVEFKTMGRKNKKKKTRSPKDSDSEYEVVPAQRVISLDNENLFVNENHFQLSSQVSNSSTENDSDIEIISRPLIEETTPSKLHNNEKLTNKKSAKKEKNKQGKIRMERQKSNNLKQDIPKIVPPNTLYSQILQKNISEENDSGSIESTAYSEDFYFDNYSAVNVLSESFPDIKASLDIVFSENADGLIEVNKDAQINKPLEPIDELDEFCFERLFNTKYDAYQSESNVKELDDDDEDDDVAIVSLKTSTLIMLFCLTVIVSMGLGNGCGSYFLDKHENPTKHITPVEKSVPVKTEKYTNILVYSNGNVRKLSISEALLGEKNRDSLIDLVESYRDLETKYDDLVKKYSLLQENYKNEKSLSLQLKRGQMKVEHEVGQKSSAEAFGEKETSGKDTSDTLWSRMRDGWRNQHAKLLKKNPPNAKANQFRKIFNIGNIVKPSRSIRKPNINYCPDEDFQNFQNRWKNFGIHSDYELSEESADDIIDNSKQDDNLVTMGPEPPKKKCDTQKHGRYKTVYNCNKKKILEVADEDFPRNKIGNNASKPDESDCSLCNQEGDYIIVEIINKKIRIVSELSDEDDLSDHTDPFAYIRKSLSFINTAGENLTTTESQTATEKIEGKTIGNSHKENVGKNNDETESLKNESTNDELEPCTKEQFGDYKTLYSCSHGKVLENKDPSFIRPNKDGCFACQVDGIYVEVVNNSIRIISKYEGENLSENLNTDPFASVRKSLLEKNKTSNKPVQSTDNPVRSSDNSVDKDEQAEHISWMRNRLAKVELEFDIYKWRVGSKLLEKISDLQFQISDLLQERKEERIEFKIRKKKFARKMKKIKENILQEKEKLQNEKTEHELLLEKEKEKFLDWKSQEEQRLKYDTKKFDITVKKRNEKFKAKVKEAKNLLKENLNAKYVKITQMKKEYERENKKVQNSVKMYERRNRRLSSQLNSLRKLYKTAANKLLHYEHVNENMLSLSSHDSEFTRYDINDQALRKVVNKYKNKHKECKWRIPMVNTNYSPGKPIPPPGLRKSIKLPFKETGTPLRPSPGLKESETQENETEITESNNNQLWYFYKTNERQLVNSYENDWYDRLMKSRRHSRDDDDNKYEGPKMNWFLKYMYDRENQREIDEKNLNKKPNSRHRKKEKSKFEDDLKEYRKKLKQKWNNLMNKITDRWYSHHDDSPDMKNHNTDYVDAMDGPDFEDEYLAGKRYYEGDDNDEIIMN